MFFCIKNSRCRVWRRTKAFLAEGPWNKHLNFRLNFQAFPVNCRHCSPCQHHESPRESTGFHLHWSQSADFHLPWSQFVGTQKPTENKWDYFSSNNPYEWPKINLSFDLYIYSYIKLYCYNPFKWPKINGFQVSGFSYFTLLRGLPCRDPSKWFVCFIPWFNGLLNCVSHPENVCIIEEGRNQDSIFAWIVDLV